MPKNFTTCSGVETLEVCFPSSENCVEKEFSCPFSLGEKKVAVF